MLLYFRTTKPRSIPYGNHHICNDEVLHLHHHVNHHPRDSLSPPEQRGQNQETPSQGVINCDQPVPRNPAREVPRRKKSLPES